MSSNPLLYSSHHYSSIIIPSSYNITKWRFIPIHKKKLKHWVKEEEEKEKEEEEKKEEKKEEIKINIIKDPKDSTTPVVNIVKEKELKEKELKEKEIKEKEKEKEIKEKNDNKEKEKNDNKEKENSCIYDSYDKKLKILEYTDDEYNNNLISDDWTKYETDVLILLSKRYDLRFIVIEDYYNNYNTTTTINVVDNSEKLTLLKTKALEINSKLQQVNLSIKTTPLVSSNDSRYIIYSQLYSEAEIINKEILSLTRSNGSSPPTVTDPITGETKAATIRSRSIEELKDRFYSIQRILLRLRTDDIIKESDKRPDISQHVLNTMIYDPDHETNRKQMLNKLLSRTSENYMVETALNYRYCENSLKRLFSTHVENSLEKSIAQKWKIPKISRSYGLPRRDPPPPPPPKPVPKVLPPVPLPTISASIIATPTSISASSFPTLASVQTPKSAPKVVAPKTASGASEPKRKKASVATPAAATPTGSTAPPSILNPATAYESVKKAAQMLQQIVQAGSSSNNILEMQLELDRLIQRLSHDRLTSSSTLLNLMNQILEDKTFARAADPNLQLVNFTDVASNLITLASKYSIPLPNINASNMLDLSANLSVNEKVITTSSHSVIGLTPPVTPSILIDRSVAFKDVSDSLQIKPNVHLESHGSGAVLRSSQPYVKFRQISSTRHKQLEIELSILKIDMNKPISHFSARTCNEYDSLRCDISTAFNLKRQLETLQKERDEFKIRYSQLKQRQNSSSSSSSAANAAANFQYTVGNATSSSNAALTSAQLQQQIQFANQSSEHKRMYSLMQQQQLQQYQLNQQLVSAQAQQAAQQQGQGQSAAVMQLQINNALTQLDAGKRKK